MAYTFRPLGWRDAEIVAGWRYDGSYAFYNMARPLLLTVVLLRPLLSLAGVCYYAVDQGGERCVGVFSFHKQGACVSIGLGLRPDRTGRGLGEDFVRDGMAFGARMFRPAMFRLTVATFNQRAIRVYERAGFAPGIRYTQWTRGGQREFMEMTRPASEQPRR
jgi:[ribosomal protein S18]-alanine N-acetyltransferase